MFEPAPGSGEPTRGEEYMQAISFELSPDETELTLAFQSSGQIVLIIGAGLCELLELVLTREPRIVRVWDGTAGGTPPEKRVTEVHFSSVFRNIPSSQQV